MEEYMPFFVLEFKKFCVWFLNNFNVSKLNYLTKYFKTNLLNITVEMKYFFVFVVFFKKILETRSFWNSIGQLRDPSNSFLHSFGFIFFFFDISLPDFFSIFTKYIHCILNILVPDFIIKVDIFFLFNNSITSNFICRFLCIKLVQGYSWRELLNPIINDLNKVGVETLITSKGFYLKKNSFKAVFSKNKRTLSRLIYRFFFIYKNLFYRTFFINNTFINLYLIWFLIWFFKKYKLNKCILVGLSRRFFLNKHGFILFFNFDYSFILNYFTFYFNQIVSSFQLYKNASFIFFFIFDDLFCNFSLIMYNGFKNSFNNLSFIAANVFFNRLLKYTYWIYNFNFVIKFNNLNKLHLRDTKYNLNQGLLGFKFNLRGRFSRRQRASSIWIKQGLVPLNTFSSYIDYGFSTTSLFNSLVSIKIWLYKNPAFYPKYFLKAS